MDSNRPDDVRPQRAISPPFRSGPRQKRNDASTDEIIRFVREHQLNEKIPNATGLRKKSVLPAIRNSLSDVTLSYPGICKGNDTSNEVTKASHTNSYQASKMPAPTIVDVSFADSGFVDKSSDPIESNSEDNDNDSNDANDYVFDDSKHDLLDNEVALIERGADPFGYKNIRPEDRRASCLSDSSDFLELTPQSVFAEEKILTSRPRNYSLTMDKLLPSSESSRNGYLEKPTAARFSNGVSKAGQLHRPRALPQLPPITRYDSIIPSRPSAPSPSSNTPSTPSSDGNGDDIDRNPQCNDDDGNDFNDEFSFETEEDECTSQTREKTNDFGDGDGCGDEVPVDFIDCR